MENPVSQTKSHINTSYKTVSRKFKDIEKAIQKAIDIETSKNDTQSETHKNYKTKRQ